MLLQRMASTRLLHLLPLNALQRQWNTNARLHQTTFALRSVLLVQAPLGTVFNFSFLARDTAIADNSSRHQTATAANGNRKRKATDLPIPSGIKYPRHVH